MSLYELFEQSKLRDCKLLTLTRTSSFDYQSSYMWSKCRISEVKFTTPLKSFKFTIKNSLLVQQSNYGSEWHDYNFDIDHFKF